MIDNAVVIRPETCAAKLAAWRNQQTPHFAAAVAREPRMVELLWAIQSAFMRPSGRKVFTADFLAEFAANLGTPSMHRIGKTDEPYTAPERAAVMRDVPCGNDVLTWAHGDDTPALAPADREPVRRPASFEDLDSRDCAEAIQEDSVFYQRIPNAAFLARQNYPYFHAFCLRIAQAELPWMLEKFCTEPDAVIESPWWFHDLPGALIEALDSHAARQSQAIAETEVSRNIARALQFAWDEKAMVKIIGDSRFGKSESVKAWAAMHPGKARLVKTPPDWNERTFLEAIADSLGIARGLEVTNAKLKATLEFVQRHCGLMFIFDEAHWLIPTRYTNKTTPTRLNYIRAQLLDNGCPVALVETPQFEPHAIRKFEKTTGFNMTQWNGRIMRTVNLPKELPESDLFGVVNIHFPALSETCAKRIVAVALMSDSFLFAVEKVAKNSRAVARENGRSEITESDIEEGIALAGFNAPMHPAAPEQPAPIRKRAHSRSITPAAPARDIAPLETATSRQTSPALTTA